MLASCLQRYLCRYVLWLAIFWPAAIVLPACAQTFTIPAHEHKVVIPFHFIRNMLVIQLKINHCGPYNFILDTGCGAMLITDPLLVDSLNIKYKKKVKVTGLGEGSDLNAWMVPTLDVNIKGIEAKGLSAAILTKDVLEISAFAGIPIHGLIGYDFFNSFPVKVNFADSTITAFNPEKTPVWRKSNPVSLLIEGKKPYINANVSFNQNINLPVKLLVDLGAGHSLSIENGWNNCNSMPAKFITAANLGVGLSGPINGYMGRINQMAIGNYKFQQVITAFPDSCSAMDKVFTVKRDGSIGVDVLKRFLILFDYPHNKLYLKPNCAYKTPFEHDMSGMEYYAAGDNFKRIIVCRVEPGSAADGIGIEKDDEIVAINFKEVARMTLQEIDQIFRSKNDRTVLLQLMRQNTMAKLLLTLKRRI